jgi:hypothetical protein
MPLLVSLVVYSALRALFIRDAVLALVYLFIGIDDLLMRPWRGLDDLLKLFIRRSAPCLYGTLCLPLFICLLELMNC